VRSYGQYCSLAKALDVLGDRWTLLIVRELMLRDSCRYTDLREGLPGIATNLLADRLRQLEREGVVEREQAPPPVATALFRLTDRGRQLEPVLDMLGKWGMPYMAAGPSPGDVFRSRWLAWPAQLMLRDREPDGPPVSIELRSGEGAPMLVAAHDGEIDVRPAGGDDPPDATITGTPHVILGLLGGHIDLKTARKRGLDLTGSARVLERLRPTAPATFPDSL
jgi:DNA-binding HxlR family transcriptional regulator